MSTRILHGDCRDVLAGLPAESVHCVVTSPPYWGLRDYGIQPTIWGGDLACEHDFQIETKTAELRLGFCRCGAWSGALGLEPTFQLYVEHIVEVFRAVRRVLRKDGTLWLNLGDSYNNFRTQMGPGQAVHGRDKLNGKPDVLSKGRGNVALKEKDLCGIPWRIAFALQADGWYLRQDIIWSKPNPMPENVTDRCTKSHEYLFLLTKSARYFYDAEAIREEATDTGRVNGREGRIENESARSPGSNPRTLARLDYTALGRNKRSVWEIATAPFPEAHFATFPPALVEPCIKASTSERGCCAKCGAPWERETARTFHPTQNPDFLKGGTKGLDASNGWGVTPRGNMNVKTIGWRPTCACDAAIVPCTVLDPFGGAGTTGLVADRLQRNAVLVELSDAYCAMAERRIYDDSRLFFRRL